MANKSIDNVMNIFERGYNKQIILYGPPGTSKTYSSTIIAAKILGKNTDDFEEAAEFLEDNDRFQLIQFHPSYNYEDFVRGIEIESNDGEVKYKVADKKFAKFARNANEALENNFKYQNYKFDCEKNYVLIIDEINRAPVASVLGELIYGLEYRGKKISTSYALKVEKKDNDEGTDSEFDDTLIIPPNLYIIGTMNTADRSIGSLDYAVRRRFAFVQLNVNMEIIKDTWKNAAWDKNNNDGNYDFGNKVVKLFEEVNKIFNKNIADDTIDAEDIKIGHTYYLYDAEKCNNLESAKKYMEFRIEYQIIPILQEYLKDGLINDDFLKKESGWKGYKDKLKRIIM